MFNPALVKVGPVKPEPTPVPGAPPNAGLPPPLPPANVPTLSAAGMRVGIFELPVGMPKKDLEKLHLDIDEKRKGIVISDIGPERFKTYLVCDADTTAVRLRFDEARAVLTLTSFKKPTSTGEVSGSVIEIKYDSKRWAPTSMHAVEDFTLRPGRPIEKRRPTDVHPETPGHIKKEYEQFNKEITGLEEWHSFVAPGSGRRWSKSQLGHIEYNMGSDSKGDDVQEDRRRIDRAEKFTLDPNTKVYRPKTSQDELREAFQKFRTVLGF